MAPARLLYDEHVTGDQVRLWAVLEDLQRDEPHVDVTTHQLALALRRSHDTVQRWVDGLVAHGWLRVDRKRGLQRANRYWVLGSPRRTRASSGTRTDDRTDASSMDHADLRDPSVLPTMSNRQEVKISCGAEGCDHGWINDEVDTDRGTYVQARRCPNCNIPTPAF